jgi:hypothetical protein
MLGRMTSALKVRPIISSFVLTFLLTLIFQILTKLHIIVSDLIFFDDLFYVERAIHQRSFNDLQILVPAYEGLNFDSGFTAILLRTIGIVSDEIADFRLIYLAFFCIASAIWGVLIYMVTKNIVLSAIVSFVSFANPYSAIMILFVTGSYMIFFMAIYTVFLISIFTIIYNENKSSNKWSFCVVAVSAFICAYVVPTSIIMIAIPFIYAYFKCDWSDRDRFRAAFVVVFVLLVVWAVSNILSSEHVYQRIDGRITYNPIKVIGNASALAANLVKSYFDAPLYTGTRLGTLAWAWFSLAVFLFGSCVILLIRQYLTIKNKHIKENKLIEFSIIVFALVLASLAPFSLITVSHLWHNFSHLIFAITAVSLATYRLWGRGVYILLSFFVLAAIVQSPQQIQVYDDCRMEQEPIVSFFETTGLEIDSERPVALLGVDICRMTFIHDTFRSTSFRRLVTNDPDAALLVVRKSGAIPTDLPDGTLVFRYVGDRFVPQTPSSDIEA